MVLDMRKHKAFLQYVCACSSKQKRNLINASTNDEVHALCNVLLNICKVNADCGKTMQQKQKCTLKRLFTTRSNSQRRTQMLQHLNSTIAPLLSSASSGV